ncbi:ABC transporter permease [Lachnospiraceae bacterium LCP25S3_G4]
MKKQKRLLERIILIGFTIAVILPVIIMLIWCVTERWAWPNLLPQVISVRAINEIIGRKEQIVQIFMSSIMISLTVAMLSVVIGFMTARALVWYEFKGKNVVYFFSVLPFMVPATVFAMGIQVIFIKLGLNNRIVGVVLAHLICSLPYAVRLMMDGTQALGNGLEEQAKVLGASPWKAFYKVTLPLLIPVILSAFSMAYIVSFSQYFLTLLIGGGRIQTFTIVMVPYLQGGDRNIACIYSTIFLGITVIIFAGFEWMAGRWNRNNAKGFYTE